MNAVLRHPGADHGIPTWVRLSPVACRSMRIAAHEVRDRQVRVAFFHPTDGGSHTGAIIVFPKDERHERGERVSGGSGGPKNLAVLDFDERLLESEKKKKVQWSVTLTKSSATASRLDFAADLLKQGHDVVLSFGDDGVNLIFESEHCRCTTCHPITTTTRKETR